jgi:hypothetical protein
LADEEEDMQVTTYAILDMETLQWVSVVTEEYEGAIALCKGDQTDKAAEQNQLSFQETLQQAFNTQYANQQSQLKFLSSTLQPQIAAGGQGYTPEQLAAQRTSATDSDAAAYQQAQAAVQNQTSQASGGSKLTGVAGANAQASSELANAEAQKLSSDQSNITTNNANLQQQNYWNSVNALNGVAANENPLGYAGSATGAGSSVAGLSQAFTASNTSPLMGLLGSVAGAAGTALQGSKFLT